MGSRIIDLGEGRYQIRAGSEAEAERLMQRMRDRAATEGKAVNIEETERSESRPTVNVLIEFHGDAWRREAARIGLAIGSLVYPPEWRLSEDAGRLREWMHDRDLRTEHGKAPPLVPTPIGDLDRLFPGDEHAVFFTRLRDNATYAAVVLFGAAYFAVPVDTTDLPVPQQAWLLDWHNPRREGLTTWDHLVTAAVIRAIPSEPEST